jgi:hypothetical protein
MHAVTMWTLGTPCLGCHRQSGRNPSRAVIVAFAAQHCVRCMRTLIYPAAQGHASPLLQCRTGQIENANAVAMSLWSNRSFSWAASKPGWEVLVSQISLDTDDNSTNTNISIQWPRVAGQGCLASWTCPMSPALFRIQHLVTVGYPAPTMPRDCIQPRGADSRH